jgi:hypothetical protein
VHTRGQLIEHLTCVTVPHPNARPCGQGSRGANEVNEGALKLDHLLAAARSCRFNVTRQCERAAPKVQSRYRPASWSKQIYCVRNSAYVLKEDVARVTQIDMRLGCAVDKQLHRARHPIVFFDLGDQARTQSD